MAAGRFKPQEPIKSIRMDLNLFAGSWGYGKNYQIIQRNKIEVKEERKHLISQILSLIYTSPHSFFQR